MQWTVQAFPDELCFGHVSDAMISPNFTVKHGGLAPSSLIEALCTLLNLSEFLVSSIYDHIAESVAKKGPVNYELVSVQPSSCGYIHPKSIQMQVSPP